MKDQSAFQKFMAAMPRILVAAAIILGCSLFIIVYVKFESLNKRIDALESANAGKLPGNQRRRELSNARLRTSLEQMEGDITKIFEEYNSMLAIIRRRLQNGSNSIKENRLLLSDLLKQLTRQKLLLLKSSKSLAELQKTTQDLRTITSQQSRKILDVQKDIVKLKRDYLEISRKSNQLSQEFEGFKNGANKLKGTPNYVNLFIVLTVLYYCICMYL